MSEPDGIGSIGGAAELRSFIEQLPAITYRTALDEKRTTLFISSQVKALGYSPAEWIGDPDIWFKIINPADHAPFFDSIKKRGKNGSISREYRVRTREGKERWVRDEAVIVIDSEGVPRYMQGVMYDITESKKNETALRESEERFRLLVEEVKEYAIMTLDADGIITSWNSGAERTKGYRGGEIIGKHFSCFYTHEDMKKKKPERQLRIAAEQGAAEDEGWRVRKDGSLFWATALVTALRDENGDLRGFAKVTRDISEQKWVREAIAASEKKYRDLVENALVGVFKTTVTGDILYANNAFVRMLEYDSEAELKSKNIRAAYKIPEDRDMMISRLLSAGKVDNFETEVLTKTGDARKIQFSATLEEGVLSGIIIDVTGRRKAEEAQRRSEDKYRCLFENLTSGFALHRILFNEHQTPIDCILLEINAAFEQQTSLKREEIVGRKLSEVLPVIKSEPKLMELFGRVALTGIPEKVQFYFAQPGKWFIISIYSTERGTFATVFDDITAQKISENKIYATNRALRVLSGCNHSLVRSNDETGFLNDLCRILIDAGGYRMAWVGYAEPGELKRVFPAARAGYEDGYLETLNATWADTERGQGPTGRAIRTGKPVAAKNIATDPHFAPWRSEAVRRGYSSCLSIPFAVAGDVPGVLSIYSTLPDAFDEEETKLLTELAQDLSFGVDALRLRKAVAEKQRLIESVFECMGEGLIVIDPQYSILAANTKYLSVADAREEDIVGRHCYETLHRSDSPCFLNGCECAPEHTFKTGESHAVIHEHTVQDGKIIYLEIRSFPIKDAEGRVSSVIEILNDITEKRKLELQVQQAQRLESIGTLAGGIAHDFNNIISAIIGYTQAALMKMDDCDSRRNELERVMEASGRATVLVQGLLAFSRKQTVNLAAINLDDLLRRFEGFLRRLIREDIEFVMISQSTRLTVMADNGQIEQVLMNMVTNARDAMENGGRLVIETRRANLDEEFFKVHGYGKPGEYALLSITDNGCGMKEKTRQRIFDPFFTTKEPGKGTGLGLAMVYGIVKKHNGFINVYSEPGSGTSFHIYLPLTTVQPEELKKIEAPADSAVISGTETVLVAEDDEPLRKLSSMIFRHFGYTVIEAADGQEAVEKFIERKNDIKVLVLDGIMPKKNGKEVFREVIALNPAVRVIILSGYAEGMFQDEEMRGKGVLFKMKPILPKDLVRSVRELLDRTPENGKGRA